MSPGTAGWSPFALRWAQAAESSSPAKNPPDLYLEWAELTDYAGFLPPGTTDAPASGWIEVLVELQAPATKAVLAALSVLQVPPCYHGLADTVFAPRLLTARVQRTALDALWLSPHVRRFELGLAVRGQVEDFGDDKEAPLTLARLSEPTLAVIDHGCPFLHEQFRDPDDALKTRIRHLWDQGTPPSETAWAANPRWGYGRSLGRAAINRLLAQRAAAGPAVRDELADYAALGHLQRRPGHTADPFERTHGAHVLDVAAGRLDTLARHNDAAARAPLLFVQLPDKTVFDSTGGSLGVRVLDALHELLALTQGPLVVNLSYGTFAGPHDGSSLIERAIDELCGLHRRLTVVVAAGNAGLAQAHAEAALAPSDTVRLHLEAPAEDRNDSFVEVWYPAAAAGALQLRVCAPDGTCSGWVAADQQRAVRAPDGQVRAALMHRRWVAGAAADSAMALLALANRRDGPRSTGAWTLDLQLVGHTGPAVPVHAWVERDDLPRGAGRGQALAFDPSRCEPSGVVTSRGTLSSLATGHWTVVVGALDADHAPAPYASLGPTRDGRQLPLAAAAVADEPALPGVRAAACRSGDSFRMTGTSVAAALVTRATFNALGAGGGVE